MASATKKAPASPPTLEEIMERVNKKQGEGTIIRASQALPPPPRLTSGSLAVDVALGGGWAAGKVHMIAAEYSNGKTSMLLQTIAACQRLDPEFLVVWVAVEEFDKPWAAENGCDLNRILLYEELSSEEVWTTVLDFMRSKSVDMVVIDSLTQLVPDEEDQKDVGDLSVSPAARVNNRFFRKSRPAMKRSMVREERHTTLFLVNQYREKIGTMPGADNRTMPGGRGKEFRASTIVDIRRVENIKHSDHIVGQTIRVVPKKNKTGARNQVAEVDFYFKEVVDRNGEIIHRAGSYDTVKDVFLTAKGLGIIGGGGGYYKFDGNQLARGEEEMLALLRKDSSLMDKVRTETLRRIDPSRSVVDNPKPKLRIARAKK